MGSDLKGYATDAHPSDESRYSDSTGLFLDREKGAGLMNQRRHTPEHIVQKPRCSVTPLYPL